MPLDRISFAPSVQNRLRSLFKDPDRREVVRQAIQWKAKFNWPEIWMRERDLEEDDEAQLWSTTLPLGADLEEFRILMAVEGDEGVILSLLSLTQLP